LREQQPKFRDKSDLWFRRWPLAYLYTINDFQLDVFSTDATGAIVSTPDVVDVEVREHG